MAIVYYLLFSFLITLDRFAERNRKGKPVLPQAPVR